QARTAGHPWARGQVFCAQTLKLSSLRIALVAIADAGCAKGAEPGPGLPIRSGSVGRPEGEDRAPDHIVDWHHPDATLGSAETAVEAVVAIVTHQENPARWNLDRAKVVGGPTLDLIEHRIIDAAGKSFAISTIGTIRSVTDHRHKRCCGIY